MKRLARCLSLALASRCDGRQRAGPDQPAHRPRRGSRRARSDAGAHLCRPHRLRLDLRQAVRHRREARTIVPQLALSHETSADGKTVTIKLRPDVKFHDGEPFDAEAAKYSLDRHLTMKGSFRKPELGRSTRSRWSIRLTIKLILKAPFSPLLAQLTDRAGMMVSPKAAEAAGDKFGLQAGLRRSLQVRRARPAGPHRGREVRRLLEQGPGLHRQDHLPADRRRHGAARQPALRRPRPDRARAGDRHQDGARRSQAQAQQGGVARLPGPHHQPQQRRRRPKNPLAKDAARAPGLRAVASTATPSTRWCSTASSCRATSGSARRIRTIRRSSRCPSATSPRPRRC